MYVLCYACDILLLNHYPLLAFTMELAPLDLKSKHSVSPYNSVQKPFL